MSIKLYKGSSYKKIMEEIIKDNPEGYVVRTKKETPKKFLFWLKDYEFVVEADEQKTMKKEQNKAEKKEDIKEEKKDRSSKLLDMLNNTITEDQLIDVLKEKNQAEKIDDVPSLAKIESTKDLVVRLQKEQEEAEDKKEEEKEKEINTMKNILKKKIEEMDVSREIANQLVKKMTDDEIESKDAMKIVKKNMEKMLRTTNGIDLEKVNIIALVGPTGVGKTTTIAKLAGALVHNDYKVGMVTTDVYRIGAVEQLEIYADIMNTEVYVANTAEELRESIEKMKADGIEKILVDTVGRSPMNPELVDDVARYLEMAEPDYISLVLSSTQKSSDISKIIKNFENVKINSLIFTKLDETMSHGIILNSSSMSGIPVSYITNGQNVPNEIYRANSKELVDKIVDGVDNFGPSIFTA